MNLIVFLFVFTTYANGLASSHELHAMCAPRPAVIQIDKLFPQKSYFPYFIKLHRCDGSCYIHPSDQKCKAVSYHEVKVPMWDQYVGKQVQVVLHNHTECACGCVKSLMDCRLEVEDWNEDQCRCTCRYPVAPPKDSACKADFRWDGENSCRCKCDISPKACSPRQEWSSESCGCTCSSRIVKRCQRKQKGLDYENCECVDVQAIRRSSDSDNPKSKLYITGMIVEGIVILGLIFILINCVVKANKKRSMTYEDGAHPKPVTPPSLGDSGNSSYSNGSVNAQPSEHKTNSNGSVCFTSQISRESTL